MSRPPLTAQTVDQYLDQTGDCWLWIGRRDRKGYGRHTNEVAHRATWKALVGPIPDGFQLDHLCSNPPCCNPAHLEPVTPEENGRRQRRLRGPEHKNSQKTHCPLGHPYDGANTYVDRRGFRNCRQCHRDRGRRGYRSVATLVRDLE